MGDQSAETEKGGLTKGWSEPEKHVAYPKRLDEEMTATRTPRQAALKALPVTVISGVAFGLIAVGHALRGDRSFVGALAVSWP